MSGAIIQTAATVRHVIAGADGLIPGLVPLIPLAILSGAILLIHAFVVLMTNPKVEEEPEHPRHLVLVTHVYPLALGVIPPGKYSKSWPS
jgi:hypothetical protein